MQARLILSRADWTFMLQLRASEGLQEWLRHPGAIARDLAVGNGHDVESHQDRNTNHLFLRSRPDNEQKAGTMLLLPGTANEKSKVRLLDISLSLAIAS
ncbi:hypothetical protein MLD38_036364 [Melastoma candidum]|uniref:Uncharacterized protein n=1 Tax=Melastoma candidum TaxID=119954 RepID=A0ACB9LIZ7_9MYRT|nr:hypothetical protein MLD38_036364 [Melastoma candidum]